MFVFVLHQSRPHHEAERWSPVVSESVLILDLLCKSEGEPG